MPARGPIEIAMPITKPIIEAILCSESAQARTSITMYATGRKIKTTLDEIPQIASPG